MIGLAPIGSAVAQIVLPGTQPGDIVNWPLLRPGEAWPGPFDPACKDCHGGYVAGQNYEPFDSWAGSMMANAARDPLFWAAVDIANQDSPGIGELCLRCHTPTAWLEGRSSTPDGSALVGYPDETDNDFEGIDCHFCHRMYEGPGGTPFTENGQYWVDDGTPGTPPPRRGPFTIAFAPHEWQYSSYHESSDFCGTCHDLRSPVLNLLDEGGLDTGLPFPEQLTYTEWSQSAFAGEGTECQDCHMPPASVTPAYACNSFNPPRPDSSDNKPVKRHDLAGANVFMMQVMKGEYGNALNRNAAYDHSISRAMDMLQNQSATVEVTVPPVAVEGNSAEVQLRVTNNTAHKLPTGYPEGRRMWVRLRATDALGATFFVSGDYDVATATLVADPQLQVYETNHGIHGQGAGFHLVQNNRIFADNRIPPRGMIPTTETMPVPAVYPDQGGGVLAHWSDVSYSVPIPEGTTGPINITATLRYQTSSRQYVEFLRDENVSGPDPKDRNYPAADDRGQKMYDFWAAYGKSAPIDMTSDSGSIPLVAAPVNVSALTASPGHNSVSLRWTLPNAGESGVKLFRKSWQDYPEFGSAGSALPAPYFPFDIDDAVADGWVEVYDGLATTFVDPGFSDSSRTVAFYAAFSYNAQAISAHADAGAQARMTSYRLADVGEVGVPGVYDGLIDGSNDLPVFSLAFGATPVDPGWNPECDFAPTHDGTTAGIPLPDDVINFEDLIVFALQFGSAPSAKPRGPQYAKTPPSPAALRVGPAYVGDDGQLRLPIHTQAMISQLRALHVEFDPQLAHYALALEEAPLLRKAGAPVFSGTVKGQESFDSDLALLGADSSLHEDGLLLTLVLDAQTPQQLLEPRGAEFLDRVDRRSSIQIEYADGTAPARGRTVVLSPAFPNPFNPETTLQLSLERAAFVEVSVYDLAGRRVQTLLRARRPAGSYELRWNGNDSQGRGVSSGVYLCRATADDQTTVRRMVLLK
jgi:hypothetical protein